MSKKTPKPKTAAAKPEPAPKANARPPQSSAKPPFEVPLDVLCDIAWRLSDAEESGELDMARWCQNVLRAYDFVWAANNLREGKIHERTHFVKHSLELEDRFRGRLTFEESGSGHVDFERAVLLLDHSKDKRLPRSINKFLNACENGLLSIIGRTLKDVQQNGFDLAELSSLERELELLPKSATHAKYGSKTEASKKKRGR